MFFVVSKIVWFVIQPLNLAVILVIWATISAWRGKLKPTRILLAVAALILLLPLVFPLERLILVPLETRFKLPDPMPAKVDGILLLGGAQMPRYTAYYKQPEVNSAAETLFTFLALARRYPRAKLVFSGGTGDILHQEVSEAETVRLFLRQQGFDDAKVSYESQSRNTYENAVFSRALVKPHADERWLMITNARTMPRAMGVFRKLGWNVTPIPCDHNSLPDSTGWISLSALEAHRAVSTGLYEWVGLAAYYLTGKTNTLFPAPERR